MLSPFTTIHVRLLSAFVFLFFMCGDSHAGSDKAIEQWINDLGSRSFRVRENAKIHLEKAGESALPGLQKAVSRGLLETRRRAMNILKAFLFSKDDALRDKAEEVFVALAKDEKSGVSDRAYGLLVKRDTKQLFGALANTDPFDKVRKKMHHKVHALSFRKGDRYTVDLEGPFDTYLRLEDANGRNLMQDDDGGVGLNSRMGFMPATDGKYRVIVTTYGAGATGLYTLTVRRFRALWKSDVAVFAAQLTRQDKFDRIRKNRYCKIYTVKLEARRRYLIDLQGNFDTYLRIEDPQGAALLQDDDGGAGLNSRLRFEPRKSGAYRIIATSFGQRATGNFTLSVQRER